MIIYIGLGNPEKAYQKTYHNIGFLAIEKLAKLYDIKLNKKGFKAVYGIGENNGQKIMLCQPQTYMNKSGECVLMLKKKFKDACIVVVCDDVDLEKGKIRHRLNGSGGTHNGLRNIVELIGQDFQRIKIGIGKSEGDLASYVLSKMDQGFIDESLNNFQERISQIKY